MSMKFLSTLGMFFSPCNMLFRLTETKGTQFRVPASYFDLS